MASIVLENISKRFGDGVAVDDVDLEIEDGEFLVLLGPSGCGKSTLLRIIAGLERPTTGRVAIGDRDVTDVTARDRDIAMVFQSYALYPHLTVRQNLGSALRLRRRPAAEVDAQVDAIADQLELSMLLDRKPKELSGGQRQRVALGRAIVRQPLAFLLDEPLSNLDAQLRTSTRAELSELHARLGTTFVYVTHDQVEAMTMATRIAIMHNGRLEQIGTPSAIYDDPATIFVAGFIGSPPMNLIPGTGRSLDGRVHLSGPGFEIPAWLGSLDEREVVVGVRPEHLSVASAGEDGPRFDVRVRTIENLGSEEVAICDLGGGTSRFAWRAPRPLGVRVGDELTLTPSSFHLFDPHTTRRLRWVDDHVDQNGSHPSLDRTHFPSITPSPAR